jgi:tetraacyldisaccharide-1-P 4'-kinase
MLDQDAPWQGYCPPAGDLRAAPPALLEACDLVLLHRLARVAAAIENCARAAGKPVLRWTCRLVGAFCPDGYVPVEELAALRLGLVLNIARPARIRNALAEAGIHPLTERLGADHAMPRPPRRAADVQAWLTTPKCATKLGQRWAGAPVWVLDRRLELPAELGRLVLQRALVSAGAVVESPPCCSEA